MNILLMLLPAIGWGLLPPIVARIGGKPANQIFGTAVGTLVVAVMMTFVYHPQLSPFTFFSRDAGWLLLGHWPGRAVH